ncbi:MAG: DNA methylase N-4, partial [Sphingobacteriales bacterium]
MDTYVDQDPEVGEGVRMGHNLRYITTDAEAKALGLPIVCTNYERVRQGNFDFSNYTAVWLDEGNYVKNLASDTTDALRRELDKIKYKFIATATPSPNQTLELVNYAHALGICDRGQILTRFFQRNSVVAGDLTLYEQHKDDFWLWVRSWCLMIIDPADMGYDNVGFTLPSLRISWIEVPLGKAIEHGPDRDGQGQLFSKEKRGGGFGGQARIKRESIDVRVAKAMQIVQQHPEDRFLIWHHLNDEHKAIRTAFKGMEGYADIIGSMPEDQRERNVVAFTKGGLKYLSTKPELNGVGCNFQRHCHRCIFVGITDSFDEVYQAMKRILRPYNPSDFVEVILLYTPEEYDIVLNLQRKWREFDEMREALRDLIRKHGLSQVDEMEQRRRTFKATRTVYEGKDWQVIETDAVPEWAQQPSNSVDLFVSSFPFGNHYEYTGYYNDFGHNEDNAAFIRQLGFLLPHMLRCLKPGRIAAIHLKNRIHYGSVTGLGFSVFHRFTHLVCDAMEAAGFHCMGFSYVPTDVVGENNQTYRLTMGEMQKDSTIMGRGIPEEIWIFRKAPTSRARGYADERVVHNGYTCPHCGHLAPLGEFQIKNSMLVRCPEPSCRTHMQPEELARLDLKKIRKRWNTFNAETIYDFEEHVKLLQALDTAGKLSRTFTTLPLRSNTPYVWNDVNRMHCLNLEQSRRRERNHICPMPYDEVDRLIEMYSNPGEVVADPFGGVGTTGYRALLKG